MTSTHTQQQLRSHPVGRHSLALALALALHQPCLTALSCPPPSFAHVYSALRLLECIVLVPPLHQWLTEPVTLLAAVAADSVRVS